MSGHVRGRQRAKEGVGSLLLHLAQYVRRGGECLPSGAIFLAPKQGLKISISVVLSAYASLSTIGNHPSDY